LTMLSHPTPRAQDRRLPLPTRSRPVQPSP
jgi:hypothetical protein